MPFTGPLEDRVAIRELMNTHAHGVMTRDADLWGAIWADDAHWELLDYPDLGGFSGKESIVGAWIESMKRYGLEDMQKPMVYFMEPGAIEVDGDRATAVAYTHEVYQDPETRKVIRGFGRYDDKLERRAGRWLFVRRDYTVMYANEEP
ncbi:MAG: nuclear transport factor 2 family protein [Pseudomonadota bacterium]